MSDSTTTVWDPLRKKEVALTPEERVRQWFITLLRDGLHVPVHMMNSEVELSFGAAGKAYRADIVVFGSDGKPAAVVECKRPDVSLDRKVLEQALRYDMVLGVKCIFITNGIETMAFRLADGSWKRLAKLPTYGDML